MNHGALRRWGRMIKIHVGDGHVIDGQLHGVDGNKDLVGIVDIYHFIDICVYMS